MAARDLASSLFFVIGCAVSLASGLGSLLLVVARPLLVEDRTIADPDWIILLGGDTGDRVFAAADAVREAPRSRVFIAGGADDCEVLQQRLVLLGVSATRILRDCQSASTQDNARRSRERLALYSPRRVLLVTTWYHTRRARRVFCASWPDVVIGVSAPEKEGRRLRWARLAESSLILSEYAKMAVYGVLGRLSECQGDAR